MAHVLIVDDEPDLARLVEFNLTQAGLETSLAFTGAQALQLARLKVPDLVLLDLMLPDISGKEVCRRLRAEPKTRHVPIAMLTARGEEVERIERFEVGADDYVTKPFSPRELVLRLQAILRRSVTKDQSEQLKVAMVRLDLGAHRAFVAGAEVELTTLEFTLLQSLMLHPGRVRTREQLLADAWGITSVMETRTVDTHVMRLRDKLGGARDMVETVRGVGYRLSEAPPRSPAGIAAVD